ncbi:MAG: hypothetical protein VW455_01920 [Nitrospinota bacterium]
MENVNHICDCLNGFTESQKKKADAIAGGSFEKILAELQILRNSFGEENSISPTRNREQTSRASGILDIFFLQQKIHQETESKLPKFDKDVPLDLEKLRRDPSTPRQVPVFLEKRFELFGPTPFNRFI